MKICGLFFFKTKKGGGEYPEYGQTVNSAVFKGFAVCFKTREQEEF